MFACWYKQPHFRQKKKYSCSAVCESCLASRTPPCGRALYPDPSGIFPVSKDASVLEKLIAVPKFLKDQILKISTANYLGIIRAFASYSLFTRLYSFKKKKSHTSAIHPTTEIGTLEYSKIILSASKMSRMPQNLPNPHG